MILLSRRATPGRGVKYDRKWEWESRLDNGSDVVDRFRWDVPSIQPV